MRYPEFIKKGDRIGYIAPSFGATMEPYATRFNKALEKFEGLGYVNVVGDNCYADKGIGKSNTAKACGEEIKEFFTKDNCDAIISCGGGETMCEDLGFVDFDGIAKAKPKWYLGYSDNTNLTLTLPTLCDTAAVYGSCASGFAMEPWHDSLQDTMDLLQGNKLIIHNYDKWEKNEDENSGPTSPYNATEPFKMTIFEGMGRLSDDDMEYVTEERSKVSFTGRLLGGCLDCLQILCGTKYDKVKEFNERYKEDGVIWFLESCDLNPIAMRRALWQLDSAGWFDNVRGFLIGRALHYDEDLMGMNRINAVTGILGKHKVPIVMDIDIGHLPPRMPVISGAMGRVDANDNKFTLEMSFV